MPVETYPIPADAIIDAKLSATTRTLAQHLDLLRAKLQAKFPATNTGTSSEPWAKITSYLRDNDVDGLYKYLLDYQNQIGQVWTKENRSGQDFYKIPVAGCDDYVYFPLLTDYCPVCNATTLDFASQLEKALTDLNGKYSNGPSYAATGVLSSSGYSKDQFNQLIANMLASGNKEYNCEALQNCWQGMLANLDDMLYQQANKPAAPYNLVRDFLSCTGLNLTTPVAKGSGYDVTRAYEQFEYDPKETTHTHCISGAIANEYKVPPAQPTDWQVALGIIAKDYTLEKRKQTYNQIYECLNYVTNPPPSSGPAPSTSYSPDEAAKQRDMLVQQARQTCDDRRAEFRRQVIQQLHQHGQYVSEDEYAWTPGPGTTGPPTITIDPLSGEMVRIGADIARIADCEVEDLVQRLVNDCKGQVTLTMIANPNNPDEYQLGLPDEMTQLKRVMFGQLSLNINNATCPNGWKSLSFSAPRLEDQFVITETAKDFLHAIGNLTQGANRLTSNPAHPLQGCADQLYVLGEKQLNVFSYALRLAGSANCAPIGEEGYVTVLDARKPRSVTNTNYNYETDYLLINKWGGQPSDACQPTSANRDNISCSGGLTDAISEGNLYILHFVDPNSGTPFSKSQILAVSEPYLNFFGKPATPYGASREGVTVRLRLQDANGSTNWVEASVEVINNGKVYGGSGHPGVPNDITWKYSVGGCDYQPYVSSVCYQFSDPVATGPPMETDMPIFDPVAEPCNVVAARRLRTAYAAEQTRWVEAQVADFTNQFQQQCVALATQQETFTITYTLGYHHFTLYYYDRAGNLMKTVPPAGVAPLTAAQVAACLPPSPRAPAPDRSTWPLPTHRLATTYLYNSLHQLEKQNSPDGGETHFFYNRKGQLRFSQNARQREASQPSYSYTRYDALGRVTEVGETFTGATGSVVAAEELKAPLGELDNMSYPPLDEGRQVTRTLYGDLNAAVSYRGQTQRYLTNRVAYSYYDVDGNPNTTYDNSYTYYSYDPHGNVEWLGQEQPNLGRKFVRYEYDLVSNKVTQVLYQEGQADQFYHRYSYDADNRLTSVRTSSDGVIWDQDARYTYFAHGPLKRLEVGEDHVQGIDYTYTLQGWLKGLNHPGQDGTGTGLTASAKDAFGMALSYFTGDYKTGNAAWTAGTGSVLQPEYSLYNGNIAAWTTKTRNDLSSLGKTTSTGTAEGEQYRYDQLNRLTRSSFYQAPKSGDALQASPDYATSYSYDPNGNLQTLSRDGSASLGEARMDRLAYHYDVANNRDNRLLRINDPTPNQPYYEDIQQYTAGVDQYAYDAIGNLTRDASGSVAKTIEWNVYGKIAQITQADSRTSTYYGYDAQGNRIHKAFTNTDGDVFKHVYYVRDAQGNVLAIYEQTEVSGRLRDIALTEQPIYGSARLGLRKPAASPTSVATEYFTRTVGQKQYELTDHLGNVRALVSDIKRPDEAAAGTYKPDLLAYYNYYPFGMQRPGQAGQPVLNSKTLAGGYRYGYNGKEKDNNGELGLTTYDYGFRIYNPGLGRFLSVDPLTSSYPWYTPYQFAGNSPIANIDVDGLEPFSAWLHSLAQLFGYDIKSNIEHSDNIEEEATHQRELAMRQKASEAFQQKLEKSLQAEQAVIGFIPGGSLINGGLNINLGTQTKSEVAGDVAFEAGFTLVTAGAGRFLKGSGGSISGKFGFLREWATKAASDLNVAAEVRVAKLLRSEGSKVRVLAESFFATVREADFLVNNSIKIDVKRVTGVGSNLAKALTKGVDQVGVNGQLIIVRGEDAKVSMDVIKDFVNGYKPAHKVSFRFVEESALPALKSSK